MTAGELDTTSPWVPVLVLLSFLLLEPATPPMRPTTGRLAPLDGDGDGVADVDGVGAGEGEVQMISKMQPDPDWPDRPVAGWSSAAEAWPPLVSAPAASADTSRAATARDRLVRQPRPSGRGSPSPQKGPPGGPWCSGGGAGRAGGSISGSVRAPGDQAKASDPPTMPSSMPKKKPPRFVPMNDSTESSTPANAQNLLSTGVTHR